MQAEGTEAQRPVAGAHLGCSKSSEEACGWSSHEPGDCSRRVQRHREKSGHAAPRAHLKIWLLLCVRRKAIERYGLRRDIT